LRRRRALQEALEKQRRVALQKFMEVVIPVWQAGYTEVGLHGQMLSKLLGRSDLLV